MIQIKDTKDFKLIARLNEEIQDLHHKMHPNIFKPYDHFEVDKFFESFIHQDNSKAYIAEEGGREVGYILLNAIQFPENPFQHSRQYVLIDQILVLKEHQGKGIGKLLLDAALSFAKEMKISSLELNHWTLNETARQFFNKNGFENYNEKKWRKI